MDHVVYYRESDGKVIGSHSSPGKINIPVELAHFGQGVKALSVDGFQQLEGEDRYVENGQVVGRPNLSFAKKRVDRIAGLAKLKALGMTDDQIKAIFGG